MEVVELIEQLEKLWPGDEVQDGNGRIIDTVRCNPGRGIVQVYSRHDPSMMQRAARKGTRRRSRKVWVLAVTDRGTVVYGRVFRTRRRAIRDLAEYLRSNEGYDGCADMPSVSDWLAEHDERLGVDLFPARLEIG
jgi:hypothetical protein